MCREKLECVVVWEALGRGKLLHFVLAGECLSGGRERDVGLEGAGARCGGGQEAAKVGGDGFRGLARGVARV
jgi:hypothetical protein